MEDELWDEYCDPEDTGEDYSPEHPNAPHSPHMKITDGITNKLFEFDVPDSEIDLEKLMGELVS